MSVKSVKKWEIRIVNAKIFSRTWIIAGKGVKKDDLRKHIQTDQHEEAAKLQRKVTGAILYLQNDVEETSIGKGLSKMANTDRENMRVKLKVCTLPCQKGMPCQRLPRFP